MVAGPIASPLASGLAGPLAGLGNIGQTPAQISGLTAWFDGADESTITTGATFTWADKSGNSNDATQTTGSAQPTTGATTLNNKNILDFDGGDTLEIASSIYSIANDDNTIFAVARQDATAFSMVVSLTEATASRYQLNYASTSGDIQYASDNAPPAGNIVTNSDNTTTNFNIMSAYKSGVNQFLSVNGGAFDTNANANNEPDIDAAFIGSRAGANTFLTGSIAEIIIYSRELSATEIDSVNNYLSTKWGISVTVPGSLQPVAWYDAADTSTITSSGGLVSAWIDKSGNSNHATQGTGSAQPTTNSTTQNGLNVLDFDGGDSLILPSGVYGITNGSNTAFVVSQSSNDVNTQRIITLSESGSTRYDLQYDNASNTIAFQSRNAFGGEVSVSGITKSDFNIIAGRRDGTTQAISFNGGAETTNASGADEAGVDAARIGAFTDGTTNPLTGLIAEVIIFNYSLSSTQIDSVEAYLAAKWGITI